MAQAILKWPGAKWRIAPWLMRFTPQCPRVVDAYCGSGGFALNLPYRPRHLILNDQDGYLHVLFRALRERTEDLVKAVTFTLWSREEFLEVTGPNGSINLTGDLVEDARRVLISAWQAHGTTPATRNGWRHKGGGAAQISHIGPYQLWRQLPERLAIAAEVLMDAEIECLPATQVIERYHSPETLIYADPPYVRTSVHGTRKRIYRYEMTMADHAHLLNVLSAHPGPVLLSGYHNTLYDTHLTPESGWRCAELEVRAEKGNKRIECLWLNAVTVDRLGYGPLFDVPGATYAKEEDDETNGATGAYRSFDP